jgi:hypothetical protein
MLAARGGRAGAAALRPPFTQHPDDHFLIDTLPGHLEVVLASPCSGHGFKFASVLGEILADLATTGSSRMDLSLFACGRLVGAAEPVSPGRALASAVGPGAGSGVWSEATPGARGAPRKESRAGQSPGRSGPLARQTGIPYGSDRP